jgi:CHASE2 domain-containing sensor protein
MRDTGRKILIDSLVGLTVAAILVAVKIGVEQTSFGHRSELFANELLQGQLSPFDPGEVLPVVVVDISEIKESKEKEVVDLDRLRLVVKAIAEHHPRAIAIDAVLTPEIDSTQESTLPGDQHKIVENYFGFLDFCLLHIRNEKGVPIFVGVGERSVGEPDEWLGGEKYKPLAATLIIPKEDTSRIPVWFRASANSEMLYALGAATAKAFQEPRAPTFMTWALEIADDFPGTERHLRENMEYADALVNYSKLEAIQQNKLLTLSEASINESGEKFKDRMVFLGDATKEKAIDTFIVTGRNEPVPGVFLHASGAYTFARQPMYEFRNWFRFLIDLLLSLVIVFWVAIARYKHLGRRRIFHWHSFQNRMLLTILIVVCLIALVLIRYLGVLWLDFLLVLLAMWLHPKIEKMLLR